MFTRESAMVYRNVSLGVETAGGIVIVSDLGALQAKIRQYTAITAMVTLRSVLATF